MSENVQSMAVHAMQNGNGQLNSDPVITTATKMVSGSAQLGQGFFALSVSIAAGAFAVRRFQQAWQLRK